MSLVTIIYGSLFYFATLILFAGIAYRIYEYATIPAPLKIPTPPAPKTKRGVAVRLFSKMDMVVWMVVSLRTLISIF